MKSSLLHATLLTAGVSAATASGYLEADAPAPFVTIVVTAVIAVVVAAVLFYRKSRPVDVLAPAQWSAQQYKEAYDQMIGRTQGILDASVDAIVTARRSMYIEMFNASAQRMFGYTSEEVVGKPVSMLMPDPYRSDHDIYVSKYLATGVTRIIGMPRELMGQRKDGSTFPLLLSISCAEVHGERLFTASIRDLSAEKQRRQQKQMAAGGGHLIVPSPSSEFRSGERTRLKDSYDEALARTQSILNASVDAIVVADTNLIIGVFNLAAEKLFGYSSDEVVGQPVSSLMPDPYSSKHDSYVRHYQETGEVRLIGIPRELKGLRKDGTVFPLLLSLSRGEVGGKTVFSACIRDLTADKQRELLLVQTQEKLHSSGGSNHSSGGVPISTAMTGYQLHEIEIGGRIGFGHFGEVFRGRWQSRADVALKKIKDRGDAERFMREAEILMNLKHPYIVQFMGMYVSPSDDLYMVTEYMMLGSLDVLLAVNTFSAHDLVDMMIQAASGMEYLHSRDILHRDLACRNLLVSAGLGTNHVIKVSDFGLACEVYGNYYTSSSKIFPVRWTAPESLEFGRFAKASDIWSFGVTMWEVMSGGAVPYPGMANADILAAIRSGYRLPQPAGCPADVYNAMSLCWQSDASKRPSFKELSLQLEAYRVVLQLRPGAAGSAAMSHSSSANSIRRPTEDEREARRVTALSDGGYQNTVPVPEDLNAEYDASAAAAPKWR
eukprot:TRINITY_DN7186_c0_g1_i1.p1 TRINITY_DN7186_c0_g1~~TRINITY_DN7186_c0_g1_i1.p1  ORF type:complete len:719 (+),score=273.41 TRINITY_DN7186_c0_g1_i1:160-2316(+)